MIGFAEFAAQLRRAAAGVRPMAEAVLAETVELAAQKARETIGHEQGAARSPVVAAEFPAWRGLSGATLHGFDHPYGFYIPGKIELGYATDMDEKPLLRDGEMRDSITWSVEGLVGTVGSTSKVALWQEMGTPNAMFPIPPRPFLSRALLESLEPFVQTIGARMVALLRAEEM